MKVVGRDNIRGKELDPWCYDAKTVRDRRSGDPRVFCEGVKLAGERYEKRVNAMCVECPAYIANKTPRDGAAGALPGQMTIDDFIK